MQSNPPLSDGSEFRKPVVGPQLACYGWCPNHLKTENVLFDQARSSQRTKPKGQVTEKLQLSMISSLRMSSIKKRTWKRKSLNAPPPPPPTSTFFTMLGISQWISPKNHTLCFVLVNSILFNLSRVSIFNSQHSIVPHSPPKKHPGLKEETGGWEHIQCSFWIHKSATYLDRWWRGCTPWSTFRRQYPAQCCCHCSGARPSWPA